MAVDVIGRDEDLRSLYAFLDRPVTAEGPVAIALEGEAGIGKSTLWSAAVEAARGHGLRVLSSRPAESEQGLAHAGLGDLFDGRSRGRAAGPDCTAAPGTRGRAPDRGSGGPAGRPAGSRGCGSQRVAAACRGRARRCDRRPSVARRVVGERAGVRAPPAARCERAAPLDPSARLGEQMPAVEDALGGDRIDRVRVGPLSVGAIQQLLRDRLSRTVPRPTLLRLHEAAGGNPFYALELARALDADGSTGDPTQPLPVPARLEELVSARLGRLHRRDARGTRARLRARATDRARARTRGHRAERTRAGARGTGGRAGERHRAVHAPVAGLGPLPGAERGRAAGCAPPPRGCSSRIQSAGLVTSRSRPISRTPTSPPRSSRPQSPPTSRARRSSPQSSTSTRCG